MSKICSKRGASQKRHHEVGGYGQPELVRRGRDRRCGAARISKVDQRRAEAQIGAQASDDDTEVNGGRQDGIGGSYASDWSSVPLLLRLDVGDRTGCSPEIARNAPVRAKNHFPASSARAIGYTVARFAF